MQKPNLHQYSDYRSYLQDWSHWKFSQGETWRSLVEKLGVDLSAWHKICSAQLHLSEKVLPKVLVCLELSSSEQQEFLLLRKIAKAKNMEQERRLRHELLQLRADVSTRLELTTPDGEFFTSWLHPVVYAMLSTQPFVGSAEKVAQSIAVALLFPTSPKQVLQSLELLLSLGWVKVEKDTWIVLADQVSSGLAWTDPRIRSYQKECLDLSLQALETLPKEEREISTLTLRMNPSEIKKVQEETRIYREKLKAIALQSQGPEELFQLNIQCFPVSKIHAEDRL